MKFDYKNREHAQIDWDKARRELDAYGRKAYALDQGEKKQIQIFPDDTISPAKFKAHPHKPYCYLANPLTIVAMKKDLFILGDEITYTDVRCQKCSKVVEKECWNFCPFCSGEFEKA